MCVGSFLGREIRAFRKVAAGRVATAASQSGTALMRFGPRAFSRFLRTPADVFQVPPVHTISGREITVITPKLLESAHRSGKHVHAWTIDDPDEMNRLLDLGVDGIVSDRIDVLKDVLTQRGVWTGAS